MAIKIPTGPNQAARAFFDSTLGTGFNPFDSIRCWRPKLSSPLSFKGIGHAVSHGVVKSNMGPIRMVVTRLFMRSVMGSVVMSRVRSRAPSAVKTKSPKNAPPENSPKAASSSPVFPPLTRQRREPDSRSRESAKWQIRKLKREDLN